MDTNVGAAQEYSHRVVGGAHVDVSLWPIPDEGGLADRVKEQYFARKTAVKLYLQSSKSEQMESQTVEPQTSLGARHIHRLIKERCLAPHEDGRVYGWRGLVPFTRIAPYKRHNRIGIDSFGRGGAGVMQATLDRYPDIRRAFISRISKHTDGGQLCAKKLSIKDHCVWFQDQLRRQGCEVRKEWPFNTEGKSYYSVRRFIEKVRSRDPKAMAYSKGGPEAVRKLKSGDGTKRPAMKFLQRVEMDAHKLDGRFCVSLPDMEGGFTERIVHRLWVTCIIDVATRVVLGYHFSMGKEVSSDDVLRCIKFALTKWKRKHITFSAEPYSEGAGFLSTLGEDFVGLCWDQTSVDGALAEKCPKVKNALRDAVGSVLESPDDSFSKRRSLDDRPFIETFFRNLAGGGFQRLSNTTGAKPQQRKGRDPDAVAITSRFQLEYAEELLDVLIANYNIKKHTTLGRPPLSYARLLFEASKPDFRRADLSAVESLLSVRKLREVRGGAKVGRGAFVECDYARYTNEILQNRQDLVGKKIWVVHHKEDDARIALASTQEGVSLGVLRAASPWHKLPHSINVRRAIARARASGKFDIKPGEDAIASFLDFVESQPGKKLPIHPAYLEARRILAHAVDKFESTTVSYEQVNADSEVSSCTHHNSAVNVVPGEKTPRRSKPQQSTSKLPAQSTRTLPPRRMAVNRRDNDTA